MTDLKNNLDETATRAPKPQRVTKLMAAAGLCSRREAERWIEQGRVRVEGRLCTEQGHSVIDPSSISVDGKDLPAVVGPRLFKFYKPTGVIVSDSDPEGRKTVYDLLPKNLPRLMAVGRLDINSEGLLLLTNNGELKRKLELPATGLARRYKVRVFGKPHEKTLEILRAGLRIEGIDYAGIEVEVEQVQGSNTWLSVVLYEGKNREIRRLFEHFNHPVSRLIRVAYGPIGLGTMSKSSISEVSRSLLNRFGLNADKNKEGWAKAKPKPSQKSGANGRRRPQFKPSSQKGDFDALMNQTYDELSGQLVDARDKVESDKKAFHKPRPSFGAGNRADFKDDSKERSYREKKERRSAIGIFSAQDEGEAKPSRSFEKPRSDKPRSDKPRGDKPRFDRGDRPQFDKSRSDRPKSDRPTFSKSQGERPQRQDSRPPRPRS